VPRIHAGVLEDLLETVFAENPKVVLKLLFNLGLVLVRKHDAGKADRDNFQPALLWLFRKGPQTYLLNVGCIAKLTSLKEALNSAILSCMKGKVRMIRITTLSPHWRVSLKSRTGRNK